MIQAQNSDDFKEWDDFVINNHNLFALRKDL